MGVKLAWLAFGPERTGMVSRLKLDRRIAIVVYPGVSLLDQVGRLRLRVLKTPPLEYRKRFATSKAL